MRSTYKQFYYINRGRVKADGTTSIFCRITIDGKVSAIATGLYCAPEEWDTKKGEAKNARVNGQLQAFRQRIDKAYEQFIREYMDFCLDERGLALDTVRHYLAILKKTCRIAFKAGHSERYHFMHFKLPQKKENPPKALTREDFLKIRDLEIPERRKSLALTRDLFLFACYTGTAYADTVSITEENLFRDEEGSLWLKYHRKKNKMLARVKLLPEALAMLEKYKDPTRPTLLPPQEFRVLRGNMKSLRVLSGISMDLVYHVGRHSFASLVTLEEGVPIETISRCLCKALVVAEHIDKTRLAYVGASDERELGLCVFRTLAHGGSRYREF